MMVPVAVQTMGREWVIFKISKIRTKNCSRLGQVKVVFRSKLINTQLSLSARNICEGLVSPLISVSVSPGKTIKNIIKHFVS